MSLAAILLPGFDPGYLRITEHQVTRELAAGRSVVVIDLTRYLGGAADSYHRAALRLFGIDYPGHDLGDRLRALGAELTDLSEFSIVPSAALPADVEERLQISVQSALITYFRTDQPNPRRSLVKRARKSLYDGGESVYDALSAYLSTAVDVIYLPNGRFPLQKMAELAARDSGTPVLHFEKGETPNGTYLKPYAPQDRLASQEDVEPTLHDFTREQVEQVADTWLARRAPSNDSSNEFSALWDSGLPEQLSGVDHDSKVVGFFTSSQDEFVFLGPEWQLHEWDDQFEAFDKLLTQFEKAGYSAYLRVHPNLATKAQDCFVRERDGIRDLQSAHPALTVLWHDDSANTYELLDHTDIVVIWDSTVGLEASARGLPVITAATSRYGLVADVREILSADDLAERGIEPWPVDAHKAKRFIAYLVERDEQMDPTFESWLPWTPGAQPFGATIAGALVAGGGPSASEAVRSLLDVYRHRSFASNLRRLRSR